MLTAIIKEIEKLTALGKSRTDKQKFINTVEVGHIWDVLAARYDSIEMTQMLLSFAKDSDLKFLINQGRNFLMEQVDILPVPDTPKSTIYWQGISRNILV